MADLTLSLVISITLNCAAPLWLWLGKDGIRLKVMRWRMRKGRIDASMFIDKQNNMKLLFEDKKGSRNRINKSTYISTPHPNMLYHFMGINLRLRRENDPLDIDIWNRPNNINMSAKELDNVVEEALSDQLGDIIRRMLPFILIGAGVLLIVVLIQLFLNYSVYENLKTIAPELVSLIPKSLQVNP